MDKIELVDKVYKAEQTKRQAEENMHLAEERAILAQPGNEQLRKKADELLKRCQIPCSVLKQIGQDLMKGVVGSRAGQNETQNWLIPGGYYRKARATPALVGSEEEKKKIIEIQDNDAQFIIRTFEGKKNINGLDVLCIYVRSIAELEQLAGVKGITDLNEDTTENLVIEYPKGIVQKFHQIKNEDVYGKSLPAEFIDEIFDDTHGSNVNNIPMQMKNCSNYVDVVNCCGAEAIKHYMVSLSAIHANDLTYKDDEGIKVIIRSVQVPCIAWLTNLEALVTSA
ncbi:MAG: hypothetical protein EZS28_020811 [Streblomastix strix]|uniref:Uncharacterized protein n=1 Tax=Streblomastix strix TaxID=222440 RepID=A0A5J4VN20_9EUKA|nr:MAG: hypothetical protein EZS28_020811 [Streblomastix strix]